MAATGAMSCCWQRTWAMIIQKISEKTSNDLFSLLTP
jgi:hypothetical protein